MKPQDISTRSFGHLAETIEGELAFVPSNLPPRLQWSNQLVSALSDADRAIGQLHGIGLNLPNPDLLITPFLRREAEMSSRIEGTQAQVRDIYLFEMQEPDVQTEVPDVREVSNYVRALDHGLKRRAELPVCLRMIRELHGILLEGVRGEKDRPGEFRRSQNWIGSRGCILRDARYVPPPPREMESCLDALEKFINAPDRDIPVLVWLAMIHYQFEAIHPFRDGNGRIGRLLLILLLCAEGVLNRPLLYLSAYFERNREEYYERLLRVSTRGEWNEWLLFFLRGIVEQSLDAFERSRQLMALQQQFHERLKSKRSALQIRLIDFLIERPVITIVFVRKHFQVSYVTAKNNVNRLVKAGILKPFGDARRNRPFIAEEVFGILGRPFSASHQ
ncbi:Fic family protein [Anaerobaca lacustris]|uniref:Fic family protein n=1 Tax=Anaerobaca lacustris TaxID=3044600 RepID=A0AAW6U1X3_9BACT|nr:Fic family protein [Sedimentisphaerales bacterium M17dextr]